MRLKPGGIRELHWHKEAEWAYMLAGRARITAVDAQGRNFIDDVGVGDLWNFPAGIPHSIQGLEEGCEFLLVFDDGNFSENETFLITRLVRAHAARRAGQELRRAGGGLRRHPDRRRARALHLLGAGAGADRLGRGATRPPAPVPQPFSHRLLGAGADQGGGRAGADRRLVQLPGREHDRRGAGGGRAGRACASCTGTRTPTSGSTTSRARGA